MTPQWRRRIVRLGAGLGLLWVFLSGALFAAMLQPNDRFTRLMARVPGPAFALMALLPFETLWNAARRGGPEVGAPAPDFELEPVEASGAPEAGPARLVRLSDSFGREPVVLVFGSFT